MELIDYFRNSNSFFIKEALRQHWNNDSYSYDKFPRGGHGLMLVIHGRVVFEYADTSVTAKAGDVVFLPKNSYYSAVFEAEADDYLINFDSTDGELSLRYPLILFNNAAAGCNEGFSCIIEEALYADLTSLRLRGQFYLLLDIIVKSMLAGGSSQGETVEKAKAMLREHYELSISEIANICGVSESALRKLFKAEVGASPNEYRLNLKLNRAKYLLEATDMTVFEISNALNFYDAAAFCKLFKKYTGITPRCFAENKRL